MSQQFCLKWNNHTTNMLQVFESLLSTEALVDVTLACDGLSLKAHKMVLSACSPFFQSLFLENPCKHPIVIMKDMRYCDLKAIIDFMYRGEVNVSHDQLSALLKTAETLKVKGLAEVTGENRHASGIVQQEITQQQQSAVSTPTTAPLTPTAQRTDTPPLAGKRKRGRPRKRSLSDSNRSDDEGVAAKIKERDSPDVEELSGDASMDATSDIRSGGGPGSSNSQSQVPSHSSNNVNSFSKSHLSISQDPQVDEASGDENEFEVEPSKLLEQTLTTDNVPSSSQNSTGHIQLPSVSGLEISRRSMSSTDSLSQALVPASDSLGSNLQAPDSPQDIKPQILSFDDPPISPVAGPSHSSERSMMMYMDQTGVASIPGPSNYQDNSALVPHDSQPQDYNSISLLQVDSLTDGFIAISSEDVRAKEIIPADFYEDKIETLIGLKKHETADNKSENSDAHFPDKCLEDSSKTKAQSSVLHSPTDVSENVTKNSINLSTSNLSEDSIIHSSQPHSNSLKSNTTVGSGLTVTLNAGSRFKNYDAQSFVQIPSCSNLEKSNDFLKEKAPKMDYSKAEKSQVNTDNLDNEISYKKIFSNSLPNHMYTFSKYNLHSVLLETQNKKNNKNTICDICGRKDVSLAKHMWIYHRKIFVEEHYEYKKMSEKSHQISRKNLNTSTSKESSLIQSNAITAFQQSPFTVMGLPKSLQVAEEEVINLNLSEQEESRHYPIKYDNLKKIDSVSSEERVNPVVQTTQACVKSSECIHSNIAFPSSHIFPKTSHCFQKKEEILHAPEGSLLISNKKNIGELKMISLRKLNSSDVNRSTKAELGSCLLNPFKKKRGRPRKYLLNSLQTSENSKLAVNNFSVKIQKQKPDHPKKIIQRKLNSSNVNGSTELEVDKSLLSPFKKNRGHPRKCLSNCLQTTENSKLGLNNSAVEIQKEKPGHHEEITQRELNSGVDGSTEPEVDKSLLSPFEKNHGHPPKYLSNCLQTNENSKLGLNNSAVEIQKEKPGHPEEIISSCLQTNQNSNLTLNNSTVEIKKEKPSYPQEIISNCPKTEIKKNSKPILKPLVSGSQVRKRGRPRKIKKCKTNQTINANQDIKTNWMDMVAEYGQSLPYWSAGSEKIAPPLCGSRQPESGYVCKVNDLVAALVHIEEDYWILSKVTAFNPDKEEYTVQDIDENKKLEYVVEASKIIPLPLYRANPTENPETVFPKNSFVLGLYPQTTYFYPAVVTQPPEEPDEPYSLMFIDSPSITEYPPSREQDVCQRYVLILKEI